MDQEDQTMHSAESREFTIGAEVMASDGEPLGSVAYVVVQPPRLHVTNLVVSTGSLLGRDIVVPVDAVEQAGEQRVHLSLTKEQFAAQPDYVDVEYQRPTQDWQMSGLGYPGSTVLWPTGTYFPQPESVTVNAPAGTVGLHEGMDVQSVDGHRVGSIDGLETNPATGDISAIVVKHGFLFTHDTLIPMEEIQGTGNDIVTLRTSHDELQKRFQRESEAGQG